MRGSSIPLLNPNQPRHTFPCVKTQLKAIKRGSGVFRKTLTKQEDFLTDAKVERWREKVRDQTLTKEEIKKIYLLTNSNLLHAPQKDALLRVLTNKHYSIIKYLMPFLQCRNGSPQLIAITVNNTV